MRTEEKIGSLLGFVMSFAQVPAGISMISSLDSKGTMFSINHPVTQADFNLAKGEAVRQGLDLTQIAIVYVGGGSAASQMGSFTPDGLPVDSAGNPLDVSDILSFQYLGAD